MHPRKDGEETRRRILDAACRVFGEKGYRDATHAEICRRAGANTAAINYHFGSKDALYRAAWKHTKEQADSLYPIDGGAPLDAPPAERLRGSILALLKRMTDRRKLWCFRRIRMTESANPTGLLDDEMRKMIQRMRNHTQGILRDILGPNASQRDIELCEMSTISQCHMARPKAHWKRHAPPWRFAARDVERLADHIARFSLAGTEAIRRQRKEQEG